MIGLDWIGRVDVYIYMCVVVVVVARDKALEQ